MEQIKTNRAVLFSMCVAVFVAFAINVQSAQNPPLKLIQSIPVPGLEGGKFDHFGVDLKGNRLFSTFEAQGTHGSVEVFDMRTNKHIQSIGKGVLQQPHSLLYREDLDRIYVTDGNHQIGAVRIYDGKSYRLIKSLDLTPLTDWRGYDPVTKFLYVNGNGREFKKPFSTVSVIDTTAGEVVATITVDDDKITDFALETSNSNMYTGMRDKNLIGVIDRNTRTVVATWPVTLGDRFGDMALDRGNHRLFVICRFGKMVIFDTQTGKELQALPINQYAHDLTYDAGSKRLYVTAAGAKGVGHASVEVFKQIDPDHYRSLGKVPTGFGARNGILVPEINRFFVSVPKHESTDARILVFAVQ